MDIMNLPIHPHETALGAQISGLKGTGRTSPATDLADGYQSLTKNDLFHGWYEAVPPR